MSGRRADYIFTFGTELLVMASMVLVYRVAARYWSPDHFAEYALARRTVGLVQLPLLLGMGVGIPRYMALARGAGRAAEGEGYFAAGLLVALLPTLPMVALVNALSGTVAAVLFGSARYRYLVGAFSLAVLGAALHGLAYSYFRGLRRMRWANTLQLINIGLVPLCAFLAPGWPVARVIGVMAGAWIVISALAMAPAVTGLTPSAWRGEAARRRVLELLRYGVPRVPGEFALTALFVLPATFVAHVDGVTAAGFVAVATTMVSAVGSLFSPVSVVLLPHASELVARGEEAAVRRLVGRLLLGGLGACLLMVLGFELVGRQAIAAFLGVDPEPLFRVARIILPGAAPFVAYVLVRSALDALHVSALNAKNLISGLVLFVAVALVGRSTQAAMLGLLAGLTVLGLGSVRDLRHPIGVR